MRCYCYETEADFILCVENAEAEYEKTILHAWFEKTDKGFVKIYPMQKGMDQLWYKNLEDKELIKKNFALLGPDMFKGVFDWKSVLSTLAQKLNENEIEWYIFGSICEAVRGMDFLPNDIDIIVHTKDFYKVKEIFKDNVVEPFIDNKDTWLVRYFGRLCVGKAIVDIASSEKLNIENHHYEQAMWNGFNVYIEPFQIRYALEVQRKRLDRVKMIEEYMSRTK